MSRGVVQGVVSQVSGCVRVCQGVTCSLFHLVPALLLPQTPTRTHSPTSPYSHAHIYTHIYIYISPSILLSRLPCNGLCLDTILSLIAICYTTGRAISSRLPCTLLGNVYMCIYIQCYLSSVPPTPTMGIPLDLRPISLFRTHRSFAPRRRQPYSWRCYVTCSSPSTGWNVVRVMIPSTPYIPHPVPPECMLMLPRQTHLSAPFFFLCSFFFFFFTFQCFLFTFQNTVAHRPTPQHQHRPTNAA